MSAGTISTRPANPQTGMAEAPKASILAKVAAKYAVDPNKMMQSLQATVFNGKGTQEEMLSFQIVCDQHDLNPFLREIYAIPKKGGGIQSIVSIDGWIKIMNSHPQMDGIEFQDELDANGDLSSTKCTIFRKDRNRPTGTIEYMKECFRNTDPWKQWPRRMLRHKATIQAVRLAFGLAGIVDQDEWEREQESDARGSGKVRVSGLNDALDNLPAYTPAAPEEAVDSAPSTSPGHTQPAPSTPAPESKGGSDLPDAQAPGPAGYSGSEHPKGNPSAGAGGAGTTSAQMDFRSFQKYESDICTASPAVLKKIEAAFEADPDISEDGKIQLHQMATDRRVELGAKK